MPSELERLCCFKKVTAKVSYGNDSDFVCEFPYSIPWTVKLTYQRRQLTTPFFTGSAITNEPTAADVLHCLLMDAFAANHSVDFEEWANELGYNPDSIKALCIYKQCLKTAKAVKRLLGDDFETFANAEH